MVDWVRNSESGRTITTNSLGEELAAELGVSLEQLENGANFLQLGFDSMRLMAWLHRLRKRGHRIKLKDLYQEPTLEGWSHLLQKFPAKPFEEIVNAPKVAECLTQPKWSTMVDGEPFALTPVQHAYLVGRSSNQTLGGVGCHLYQEFDGMGLKADALEQAIVELVKRHPVLMLSFLGDGRQQYRKGVCWQGLTVHDLRFASAAECQAHLQLMREQYSHRVLAVERGQNFDFHLTLLNDGQTRLHVDIDLLVLDASSFSLFFDELAALVRGENLADIDKNYDFKSYLAHVNQEDGFVREQSRQYWMRRLDTLPEAPNLPLRCEPELIEQVRTSRRREEIQCEEWACFKNLAVAHGVTPTMALATCFSAVLALWSSQSRFLLNLTLFDRQPLHPAVDTMVADFTNILLLDLIGEGKPFNELAQSNQQMFADAYEHRHWSGVELLRELRRNSDAYLHGAPIVFTSNLGRPMFGHDVERTLGTPAWGISQTPQVWIDHLAYEQGGSVFLQWDSIDALFPTGMLDAMFDAYVWFVRYMLSHPKAWHEEVPDLIPHEQLQVRKHINMHVAEVLSQGLLHERFWEQVSKSPDSLALLHGDQQVTYKQLAGYAQRCAGALVQHGVKSGDHVAISMPKGLGQVVAVLGVLYAGAVYVPVSLDQPMGRRQIIYQEAQVNVVLTCQHEASVVCGVLENMSFLSWQKTIEYDPLPTPLVVDAASPAYIIYTSGSTGTPKGVVVSHQGAFNTCSALNKRYQVSASDRVLGLSALHFDLSVYDIFGLLSAGGALVLIDETQLRDPAAWCEAIDRHGVTLWNTVPALFDMLLTYSEGFELSAPSALRLAMLSGDWIGLDLPKRYQAFRADGQFVAMGGATEASIWSNAYDVQTVMADWRSIPYGYPLANQKYRVASAQNRDCPDWVPGELWIGGDGVALGYFNDPERTAQQFVRFEGERWYRTGDMGCYWPDGTLEFLGRRDKQVKIGGFRIELGEIEAALLRIHGVKNAIAMAIGEREKSLIAFIVPQSSTLSNVVSDDTARPISYAPLVSIVRNANGLTDKDIKATTDNVIAHFIFEHLWQNGVDLSQRVTVQEVMHQYRAQSRWVGLFTLWLEFLQNQQFVHAQSDRRYAAVANLPGPSSLDNHPLFDVLSDLRQQHESIGSTLRGMQSTASLFDHSQWTPEYLLLRTPGMSESIKSLAATVQKLAKELGRPVRLHEVGMRSGLSAEQLLKHLQEMDVQYTGWDESPEMILRASARLKQFEHAEERHWHVGVPSEQLHRADLVWANNALHRLGDTGLQMVLDLAAPAALVYVQELRQVSSLALITAELLEIEKSVVQQIHDLQYWQSMLNSHDMRTEASGLEGDVQWLALRAPVQVLVHDDLKLKQALGELLPDYMLPKQIVLLDSLPLTANGKVDHRTLVKRSHVFSTQTQFKQELPKGDAEKILAELWSEWFKQPVIYRNSHFFHLGGDSLLATRLIGELVKYGYAAELADLFEYPELASFATILRAIETQPTDVLTHDPVQRYEPFALTDVQQAYLVGRKQGFTLGGVGSHFFVVFEVKDLQVRQFEQVIDRLIERHDTLRTVVRGDQQQVLAQVPNFKLRRHVVSALDSEECTALRDRLARQVLDPSHWPVFDIQAAQVVGSTQAHLFVSLDNLMLDGLSMQIFLAELEHLYSNPAQTLPKLEVGFRDYLEYVHQQPVKELSRAYWNRRLNDLSPAPNLPLRCDPVDVDVPRFVRLTGQLSASEWEILKKRARTEGLTPSALLLAAYATTLSAWALQDNLCLNVTLFDRLPVHAQIEQVLGDFTTLLLLDWHPTDDWLSSAHRLQQRLRQDLLHRDVSAIHVMRQLAEKHRRASVAMPVIFTSALGLGQNHFLAQDSWLKPIWGLSHTPQIWLDNQVYESAGQLCFNWDYVEELFEPSQVQTMFERYENLLLRLATDKDAWELSRNSLIPRLDIAGHRMKSPSGPDKQGCAFVQMALADDDAMVVSLCRQIEQVTGLMIQPRQAFFEAGLNSVKLVELHAHLARSGYIGIVVTDLFVHTTPLSLAMYLKGMPTQFPDASLVKKERRDLLEQRKLRAKRRQMSA